MQQTREQKVKMLQEVMGEGEGGALFQHTHQPIQHLIQHHPQTPPVHCWTVWFAFQHLRGEVLRRPTKGVHDATDGHSFFTESKVCQHRMTLAVQQDVLWFEVSDRDKIR